MDKGKGAGDKFHGAKASSAAQVVRLNGRVSKKGKGRCLVCKGKGCCLVCNIIYNLESMV